MKDREEVPPVAVGEEYEVETMPNKSGGDDPVARVQGFVIFVKGASVGQKVRVKIDELKHRCAIGHVVE